MSVTGQTRPINETGLSREGYDGHHLARLVAGLIVIAVGVGLILDQSLGPG
jgi:hypothetical protein